MTSAHESQLTNSQFCRAMQSAANVCAGGKADRQGTVNMADAQGLFNDKMRRSISNIFRTKNRMPGLQGSTPGALSDLSRSESRADDDTAHWTIAVPAISSEAMAATQAANLELASCHIPPSGHSSIPNVPPESWNIATSPLSLATCPQDQEALPSATSTSNGRLVADVPDADQPSQEPRGSDSECAVQAHAATQSSPAGMPFQQSTLLSHGSWQDHSDLCWQAIDVNIYSLGSFAFKGMGRDQHIAQVLPTALISRLALFSHVLKRGKATLHKAG